MMKQILPLTGIVALRFLGLFIVLPIIALYANSFHNTSAFMIGLVVGGAYLTQLIFQTPFGILSDKFNRKYVVLIGLIIFFIGSMICAFADSIELLVIGRLIQGTGAIGGVVSAQVADMVKEEQRTKAMAIMGGGIFASFTLAMVIGPIIGGSIGARWLFLLTALLTLLSIFILYFFVPNSPKLSYSFQNTQKASRDFLDKNLWIMNLSSFFEKMLMSLIFVIIPLALVEHFYFDKEALWKIYVPSAILGIFAMAPASILAEKYNKPKLVLLIGIFCFLVAYTFIALADSNQVLWFFILGVFLFFIGFAMLEPIMQSLASKYAKAYFRGTALGNFTTASYIGSFIGGMFGALLYHHFGLNILAIGTTILCIFWLFIILFLDNPQKQKNIYLTLQNGLREKIDFIQKIFGVIECYVNENEKVLIIKYNSALTNEQQILEKIQ
ncbi:MULTISPECIES: MFS transporter [unclassified Helicobacter]|uniref:MFS transporter n=1 Tax=unclassified Helicobacter TaxID=2593540 RepID=UPI000CF0E612|nr:MULTISPECIES: MFS transporter [unclassified Helicobacter]